ncbi:unnamed protein product, partial [Brassica oleracea var. botrytis]
GSVFIVIFICSPPSQDTVSNSISSDVSNATVSYFTLKKMFSIISKSESLKASNKQSFKLSFMDKFKQISSRQGRERSSSTSSFQERIFPPQSLFVRGDPHPVFKTGNIYQYLNRLLSYVKVRLGPVDATTFIPKGVEVLDGVAT